MKKYSENSENNKRPKNSKGTKTFKKPLKSFDIKNYYTPQGEHPEDRIFKELNFIRELEKVQTLYFDNLSKDLRLNDSGETLLFDYIHNYDQNQKDCFNGYLEKLGKTYKDCLK